MRKAAFIDRDGTIIELVDHLTDPDDVRLIDGAARGIGILQEEGYACVVITNQSVVGRGMLTLSGLEAVHEEMRGQLHRHGIELDGLYFCPVKPAQTDPTVIEHLERKPGPGMILEAARDLALDVGQSWMIGDSLTDMLTGKNAGCRGSILVRTGYGHQVDEAGEAVTHVARDLLDAAKLIKEQTRQSAR